MIPPGWSRDVAAAMMRAGSPIADVFAAVLELSASSRDDTETLQRALAFFRECGMPTAGVDIAEDCLRRLMCLPDPAPGPPAPAGQVDDIQQADHAAVDAVVDELLVVAHDRLGHESACRRCAAPACCSSPVWATPAEALLIARHVETSPQRAELLAAMRAWLDDGMADAHREVLARLRASAATGEPDAQAAEWPYLAREVPCPLLVQGRCAVYEVRPRVCRALVRLDDPTGCGAYARGERPRPPAALHDGAVRALLRRRAPGAERRYIEAPLGVMVELVVLALDSLGTLVAAQAAAERPERAGS